MKKSSFIVVLASIILFGYQHVIAQPDHITLTWSGNPLITQTITWRTDTTVLKGEVKFVLMNKPQENDKSKVKSQKSTLETQDTIIRIEEGNPVKLKTDIGSWNIHSVVLTGLHPGEKYCYSVGYGNEWSSRSSFTTESENSTNFKFLIFGDSQSGNADNPEYKPFQTTIHNAFNANPDSRFFINMGDLVETGAYYAHWNNWFKASKDIINNISFMPVQGNHETYGNRKEGTLKPENFTKQFMVPQNGPEGFKGQVYSYDYGDVHFAVWDSQFEEEQKFDSLMKNKEVEWLDNDLRTTNKKWKIVLFHKTPYYNKHERANDNLKAVVQPIIDKYHVDIVLNGHDHGVSRTFPIKNDEFVAKPSEGTVYYVTGRSGGKTYSDLKLKVWDAFFSSNIEQPNYVVADVNGDELTLKAYNQDGTLFDSYTIDKSKDADIPMTKLPGKFKETRLAIYGELLAESVSVKKIDNKWYIPAEAFAEFMGGKSVVENGKMIIKVKEGKKESQNEISFRTIQQTNMISSEDIKAIFGFNTRYDEGLNLILLSKDPVKI